MKVLVACEKHGRVRDAFRSRGHDAWSCDLQMSKSDEGGYHLEGDVRRWLGRLDWKWDLMIAFPPCTYLCNSGVRWLYNKDGSRNERRWLKMFDGAHFFDLLLMAPVSKIAVENPIMHGHAKRIIGGRSSDQIIHPWQFGHGETKATCLWLKNLPLLEPTNIVEGREARVHKMSPSENRGELRSITYQGIADAMAEQWG